MRYWITKAAGAAGIGLVVAACSSGSGTATTSPATSPATTSASSPAATATGQAASARVSLHAISGIPGQALVSSTGRTLYLFEADKNGTSTCTGACAAAWPPDTVTGTPQAGARWLTRLVMPGRRARPGWRPGGTVAHPGKHRH